MDQPTYDKCKNSLQNAELAECITQNDRLAAKRLGYLALVVKPPPNPARYQPQQARGWPASRFLGPSRVRSGAVRPWKPCFVGVGRGRAQLRVEPPIGEVAVL